MALAPVVVPPYPNVPPAAGVPAMKRSLSDPAPTTPAPLTQDGPGLAANQAAPVWGVFDSEGVAAIAPDTVVDFEFRKENPISTFPVEEGKFESYNKVETPSAVRLTLAKGGTEAERAAFIVAMDFLAATTNLYTVVTPEASYLSMNVDHVDYGRKRDKGANLITASLWFEQVRVTATATYTQTKTPSGAATVNSGAVRTKPPTPTQAAAIGPPV